jgi:hypothetical protein
VSYRVCAVLDTALAAASNPSALTPSSIVQQLRQARKLYESDKEASFELVERLLADVEDAQVGLTPLLSTRVDGALGGGHGGSILQQLTQQGRIAA